MNMNISNKFTPPSYNEPEIPPPETKFPNIQISTPKIFTTDYWNNLLSVNNICKKK